MSFRLFCTFIQTSGQHHSVSIHLPLLHHFLCLMRKVNNFICFKTPFVYSEVRNTQIRKHLKSPGVALGRGWVIQNKVQNLETITTSLTVVCLFPTALLPTGLPLTSKKSQPRGGPEDTVQTENQTHDKRLKEAWSKPRHKSASPWLALAHGPQIFARTESALWSDWKRPCPDELSGQREI